MDIFNYEWQESAKGNFYTEIEGNHCVVGQDRFGKYFALVRGRFLEKKFNTLDQAKKASYEHALLLSDFEKDFGSLEVQDD